MLYRGASRRASVHNPIFGFRINAELSIRVYNGRHLHGYAISGDTEAGIGKWTRIVLDGNLDPRHGEPGTLGGRDIYAISVAHALVNHGGLESVLGVNVSRLVRCHVLGRRRRLEEDGAPVGLDKELLARRRPRQGNKKLGEG